MGEVDPEVGRMLDELAVNATVAPLSRLIDGWLCKVAPAIPFRRANAVLPAPGAGTDARATSSTLDAIEAWYGGLGQRVIIQVSSADPQAGVLDELLAQRGYGAEAPVDLLVAETALIVDAGSHATHGLQVAVEDARSVSGEKPSASGAGTEPGPTVAIVVEVGVDEAWARRYGAVHGTDEVWRARTEAYGRMLAALGPAIIGGVVAFDDHVVGIGFAVLERGWAGVYGMGTAPERRRMGVAGALLGALAVEVRRHHGTHLYLQVETDNHPAQALYRGLGFAPSHGYHYRVSSPP